MTLIDNISFRFRMTDELSPGNFMRTGTAFVSVVSPMYWKSSSIGTTRKIFIWR